VHAGDLEIFGRLAAAAGLGFTVGWEREVRGQDAGDRTFALVALGAAAFTALGVEALPDAAERIISGIVTGVGFIGAGLLLQQDGKLKGLTTAAAVWAAAAIGVLAGAGRLVLALATTALVLLTLELRSIPGLGMLDARRHVDRMREDD